MALLKRRFVGDAGVPRQNPRYVFGEQVELVNTSNHYTAPRRSPRPTCQGLDVNAHAAPSTRPLRATPPTSRSSWSAPSPSTTITPMLAQWLAAPPSTGQRTSAFKDMGVRFPDAVKAAAVTRRAASRPARR